MLKALIIFLLINNAFAAEIIMEKNGHKQTVKIPDDAQKIVLTMERSNSEKKDKIYLNILRDKQVENKKCPLCSSQKKNKITKKKINKKNPSAKKIIIAAKYEANNYNPEKNTRTIEVINIYHYFYPCSVNPQMSDCAQDQQIKIDNSTDRMVIIREDGTIRKIDMVDSRAGIKKTLPNDDTPTQNKSFTRSSPIFDVRTYRNNQLPTNDPYITINDPIYQKHSLGIVSNKNTAT